MNEFKRSFNKLWLAEVPYQDALIYQKKVASLIDQSSNALVLGLEHPRVVTLGARFKEALLISGIPVIRTDRGGQATLHNPGQLVIYPILPLKKWGLGVREYVDLLLQTTENFCIKCNIIVYLKNNGLHTKNGKIASVGINVKKGISTHGIALNISNNLEDFNLIEPCGVQGQAMDRVANYYQIALPEAFELWCREFEALLKGKSQVKDPPSLTSMAFSP